MVDLFTEMLLSTPSCIAAMNGRTSSQDRSRSANSSKILLGQKNLKVCTFENYCKINLTLSIDDMNLVTNHQDHDFFRVSLFYRKVDYHVKQTVMGHSLFMVWAVKPITQSNVQGTTTQLIYRDPPLT